MADFWEGIEKFTAAAQMVKDRKTRGARQGLGLALLNTLNVSNEQVPIEEHDLEQDGGTSIDDANLLGAVSYGRRKDTKDYAVEQHERFDFKHDPGRNAKFLENAFNATRAENLEIIGYQTKTEMGT